MSRLHFFLSCFYLLQPNTVLSTQETLEVTINFSEAAHSWRTKSTKIHDFIKGRNPDPRPSTKVTTSTLLYCLRSAQVAFSLLPDNEKAARLKTEARALQKVVLDGDDVWEKHWEIKDDTDAWGAIWKAWRTARLFLEREDVTYMLSESNGRALQIPKIGGIGLTFQKWSYSLPSDQPDPSKVTVTLANGIEMPMLGLGTWHLTESKALSPIQVAVENGYRHIDTANNYRNEKEIGDALKTLKIGREELFIATKLSKKEDYGKDLTRTRFEDQLGLLGVEYIDLYMIHGPIDDKQKQREAWEEMEVLYEEGKIRALGVSNYNIEELENLFEYAKVKPHVVQNRFTIYNPGWFYPIPQESVLQFCTQHGIQMVGYSILNTNPMDFSPLDDPVIKGIAQHVGKTPAQVLHRWALQLGVAIIPRSANPEKIIENASVFTFSLDDEMMRLINGIVWLNINSQSVGYMDDVFGLSKTKTIALPGQVVHSEL